MKNRDKEKPEIPEGIEADQNDNVVETEKEEQLENEKEADLKV